MKRSRIGVGYFGMVIFFSLLILVPTNVFAQENYVNATLLSENYQLNGSVSLTQKGIETYASPEKGQQQGPVYGKEPVFITDSNTGQKYIKDRVIVRFKSDKTATPSVSQEKIRMAHAKVGAKVKEDFSAGPAGVAGLQVIQLPSGTDVQSAIREYESNPDVLYAEPDYEVSIPPDQSGPIVLNTNTPYISSVPNDIFFTDLWGMHNTGQNGGISDADIDAPEAWDISTGSDRVIVAVIDTGVNYTHSDLSSNIWSNADETLNGIDDDHNGYVDDVRGWDFVNSDNDPRDDNSHGTHCAGTIGAIGNNGIGVAGVNWHVKIMPVKVLDAAGSGSWSGITAGVIYAGNNGAQVISMSLSGTSADKGLEDAIIASPAVVVCAADNQGINIDETRHYPASFTSANIIAVAATNRTDDLVTISTVSSWGSNYGATSVDLAAPGQDILSTYYISGQYQYKGGTSMATPHVAGVAGLVKATKPSLNTAQIKNIILTTVDQKSSLTGKVVTGGRLNAYNAVVAARNTVMGTYDKIGVYQNGVWYLDNDGSGGWNTGDKMYTFGAPGWTSVLGDWDGDDITEIGVYQNGVWYLDNDGSGGWNTGDKMYTFGTTGWTRVVGDWDGDDMTEIGVYRDGVWYLDDDGSGGWNTGDKMYTFGSTGWTPVVGDWNGDRKTKVGVTNGQQWYLDWNGNGEWNGAETDRAYTFGAPGWTPVLGNWSGSGPTKIGVTNGQQWYLDWNGNGTFDSGTDKAYSFGAPGWKVGSGDCDGDGWDEIGVTNGQVWYVDWNGNGEWNGAETDRAYTFGAPGWTPVVGKWS